MSLLSNVSSLKSFSWSSFGLHYLFFFYFSGLYQIIIFASGQAGGVGLRQAILMSFLWFIPILLIPRYTRIFTGIIGSFLWVTSLVSMGYLALYGQDFSQSVLYIIFESNLSEGSEFLESYFSWWMLPALVIYTIIPFFIWKKTKPMEGLYKQRLLLAASALFIISWPLFNSAVLKQETFEYSAAKQMDRMEPAAPWHIVMGYIKYKSQLRDIEKYLLANDNLPPLDELKDKNAMTPNTLVLVIGESTNRQRMGIYGYGRDTTPGLKSIKDDLLIFEQVYSPRPYTIETLQQVLSFADEKHPDLYLKRPTLMNIMKQAGYKTYWITNQQTQTKRNTMLTTFSKQADEQVYLNNNRMQDSAQYDGVVIKPFEKILGDTAAKKFIVIHLLGTHRKYHYRYPDSFAFFNKNSQSPNWLSSSQTDEYNEYDNAIRYNDFVVSTLIKSFKTSREHGFLVYFSDHGEEVYDNPQHLFAGRNEGAPSSPMYTIPFMIWQSESWKNHSQLESEASTMVHRSYSTSDFIYTWSDLAGITFTGFDASRSIVNPSFTNHPIWIGNPKKQKKLRDLQKQPFIELHKSSQVGRSEELEASGKTYQI
ncbi:MAG: phosphoethanolamine transferase CptA [gamma proteobacterium symbiont of Bathyaustriella thionipta]|nr:phosphoethanolamine transferase CptA [gamma proteobacterium symbiont of Bathyaustriella thionipta]MCU7949016.1 phosphoethanolamine transferase CptA [gamma proteobacterium symbiont of Bathyaustriella thionipta]MCU7952216.1 phosphoethanolamine transferase CptA [gamma proteobacterium symbiont of Bathyaustriella thionipta]MCU7955600.1 phosphoethanolamine transferase CptA [gamma proteobacterium symbiont of Bathyaustriella thionipta]MCU7967158.1 phosphoethanolamine transferase CptA [gamma proteoba